MEAMQKFTIYCTPEQTKKALELGAPIETFGNKMICRDMIEVAKSLGETEDVEQFLNKRHATIIGDSSYRFPTAEQMIGWLETHKDINSIVVSNQCDGWGAIVFFEDDSEIELREFSSREQATLAAIDAALEYLTKNNK